MATKSSDSNTSGSPVYLPRGAACVSCRRRKMKCDGQHPVCGPCARSQRPDDCEYISGNERSTVQILEETIGQLESRVRELQKPQSIHHLQLTAPQEHGPRPSDPASLASIQDPPREIAEKLLDTFLAYAGDFGFFMHTPRFRASFLQGYPPGHPARPAPALIYATYLLAIHFSKDLAVKAREGAYMEKAIHESIRGLGVNHPHKFMHSIQAEVLLANYFFANGRFVEGKHHLAYAVSTALEVGLHKIRSASPSGGSPLPRPNDSIEEGERILAAWTVFNLDNAWAVALHITPNFEHADGSSASQVDTPWPLEMDDFEQGKLPQNVRTEKTVAKFLVDAPTADAGVSSRAIESKAVILWDRANVLINRYNEGSPSQDMSQLTAQFSQLDRIVEGLKASLPPPPQIGKHPKTDVCQRMVFAYSIIGATVIRLHAVWQGNEASRRKRLSAAQMILDLAASLAVRRLHCANPIIGFIWVEAAQVLLDEVILVRSIRTSGQPLAGPPPLVDDNRLLEMVRSGLTAMETFTPYLPLTSFQVKRIHETFRNMC